VSTPFERHFNKTSGVGDISNRSRCAACCAPAGKPCRNKFGASIKGIHTGRPVIVDRRPVQLRDKTNAQREDLQPKDRLDAGEANQPPRPADGMAFIEAKLEDAPVPFGMRRGPLVNA
jgi:hypothetical protein